MFSCLGTVHALKYDTTTGEVRPPDPNSPRNPDIIIVVQVIRIDCSPVVLPTRLRWNIFGTLRNGQSMGNGRLELD